MGMARVLVFSAVLSLPASTARATDTDPPEAGPEGASAPVSYYRDIRPIFRERCQGCHQPARARGKLDLTSHAALLKAGKSDEPVIVPGDPGASLLMVEITSQEGEPPSMPDEGEPLAPEQVELIRRWIAAGAEDDSPPSSGPIYTAERPPVYHALPVITALDFSPDGSLLAVSGYHEVLLHRADGSALVARLVGLSPRIESLAFSPDGKLLAVTGGAPGSAGEVQIWNVEKRSLELSLPVTHDTVYGASWSPDGKRVAFGCGDNTVRAIEARTGKQVLYQGAHNDWVLDTIFSTDASHLVSVSRDRSMKLTQVKTEQFIDNITSITPGALRGGLMAVDRHPERDELLVGGADGVPKIYRMYRTKDRKIGDDFNLIRKFESLPGRLFVCEYSPDGSRVLAGSSLNGAGEVRVYEEKDAKQVSSFSVKSGGVYAAAFGAGGKTIAAGGFDGRVRLIETDTGKQVGEFPAAPLGGDDPAVSRATVRAPARQERKP